MHHTAAYWIEQLHLIPLPEEGGMYRENYRSADVLQPVVNSPALPRFFIPVGLDGTS